MFQTWIVVALLFLNKTLNETLSKALLKSIELIIDSMKFPPDLPGIQYLPVLSYFGISVLDGPSQKL